MLYIIVVVGGGGRETNLPQHHEVLLAKGLTILERWGRGLSRKEVMQVVESFVNRNKLTTCFKNGKPGDDWFMRFKKRHQLSVKKPESIQFVRQKQINPFTVYGYFENLQSVLSSLNVEDKPGRIWNLDETYLCLDPKKTKVVGATGAKCSRVTTGTTRENITILTAVSADGRKAPAHVVFTGKHLWSTWFPEGDSSITISASPKGWMNETIFANWFRHFVTHVLPDERPVLIIYDGHGSHLTPEVVVFASENNVSIIKLPSHTTHLLQPLDIAVFSSFKTLWDEEMVRYQRQNPNKKMSKSAFSMKLEQVWNEVDERCIQNGFRKAGIVPFNPNVIPKSSFTKSEMKKYIEHKQKSTETNNRVLEPSASSTSLPSTSSSTFTCNDPATATPSAVNLNDGVIIPAVSPTSSRSIDVSFEDLLLDILRPATETEPLKKRKKVAAGSEVMTSSEAVKKLHAKGKAKITQDKKAIKCKTQIKATHQQLEDNPSSIPSTEKTTQVRKGTMKRKEKEETDSSSSSEEFTGDNSSEYDETETLAPPQNVISIGTGTVKAGEFILVKFKGGKRGTVSYIYLCMVREVLPDNEYSVLTLKSQSPTKTVFTCTEEETIITHDQILGSIATPVIDSECGTRIKYKFCNPLTMVFEAI